MPVPGGEITSTETWTAPEVPVVEEVKEELVQDDLPEL